MTHLVWTNDLNTGINVIDGQHRRIVEYINQLHDARLAKDRAAVGEVIEAAVDYTLSHFGFEEALLEDADYEFLRPHKKVHELFIRRLSELRTRFKAGEDVSEDLHNLLSRWLFSHIRSDDMNYVPAVRAKMVARTRQEHNEGWVTQLVGKFFRAA
jgi:hemerythrin